MLRGNIDVKQKLRLLKQRLKVFFSLSLSADSVIVDEVCIQSIHCYFTYSMLWLICSIDVPAHEDSLSCVDNCTRHRVPVTLGTRRSGNLPASLIACLRFSRLWNGSENGPGASWIVTLDVAVGRKSHNARERHFSSLILNSLTELLHAINHPIKDFIEVRLNLYIPLLSAKMYAQLCPKKSKVDLETCFFTKPFFCRSVAGVRSHWDGKIQHFDSLTIKIGRALKRHRNHFT